MTVEQILTEVLDRIRGGWTPGASARTRNGTPCDYSDPKAVKFCLLGALWRVHLDHGQPEMDEVFKILSRALLDRGEMSWKSDRISLLIFNERTGRRKREVIALLEDALELTRAEDAR